MLSNGALTQGGLIMLSRQMGQKVLASLVPKV